MRPEIHRARINIKSLAAEAVFIRQEKLVATCIITVYKRSGQSQGLLI